MKIIDLLNKIANGEEVPKKIRIDHWCYKFEWVEHLENYFDKENDIDIMSALSMSQEELNYEVEIIDEEYIENKIKNAKSIVINGVRYTPNGFSTWVSLEEDKKIEKLKLYTLSNNDSADISTLQDFNNRDIQNTINKIIDKLNESEVD